MNTAKKDDTKSTAILDPALLEKHRILAQQLAKIKKEEMELRNEILDVLLDGKESGTHNFMFDHLKVKAVKSFNYRLDSDHIANMINGGTMTPEEQELLRLKFELKLADYKKAGDTPNIDEALTVSPAQPSLSITLED